MLFKRQALLLLLSALLLTACSAAPATEPAAGGDAATPTTAPQATETAPPSPVATDEPPTPTAPPTMPAPEITPTAPPEATAEAGVDMLAGVVYQDADGLWQIEADGQANLLSEHMDVDLSPDGAQALTIEEGDVWLLDLASQEMVNLTADSGREHVYAQWWPERPETLLMGSWDREDAGPNNGALTLVEADGSHYRLVNEAGESSFAFPAGAPDGETIAYDEAGQPMLYHLDDGVTAFDPYAYGISPEIEVLRAASPAWSPDGNKLAWIMTVTGGGYGEGENWDAVTGIFDLQEQTAQLIHPFQPLGRGGWFYAPLWSPDGRWLLFQVESQDNEEYGLWAFAADGSAEHQLNQGAVAQAWWSPPGDAPWHNGRNLLLAVPATQGGFNYSLVDPTTWDEMPVELPPQSFVRGWRAIP